MEQGTAVAADRQRDDASAFPAIADYAFIGNCRSSALVARDGDRPRGRRAGGRRRGGGGRVCRTSAAATRTSCSPCEAEMIRFRWEWDLRTRYEGARRFAHWQRGLGPVPARVCGELMTAAHVTIRGGRQHSPQAFSHIGVISAALAIARAEAGERRPITA